MPKSTDDLQRQLLQTFQVEAQEHLQKLNETLLQLEREPDEVTRHTLLQEVFRTAHSLKGAARAVSLIDIENLAHAMENVLQQVRDAKLELTPDLCDILYDTLDAIQQILGGGSVDTDPISTCLLEKANNPYPQSVNTAQKNIVFPELSFVPGEETIRVAISKLDDLMAQAGELIMAELNTEQHLADVRVLRDKMARWPKLWREMKLLLLRLDGDAGRRLADLLFHHHDYMQALAHDITALEQTVSRDSLNLSMSLTRLQDEVRRVRLVPIQTLVPVLQRAVRDAARSEEKFVEFTVVGGEVELDKKVLEILKDPLLHLVRNSVIHGIERPDTRTTAGKSTEGEISLIVHQQGSEVHITVHDDGCGFDVEALRRKSAEQGGPVFDSDANPNDIISTVAFQAGMTTMQQVTELAGRGVGLDVVREGIMQLRGRIKIENAPGEGADIELVVPVSLALSRGLLVLVGSEQYALPLISVEKIVEANDTFTIGGHTGLKIGDRPLPLVSLAALLHRSQPEYKSGKKPLVVIISVAEQQLAVQVDDVLTEQELTIKPLGNPLRHVRNVEGAALLSTGQPIVVLNPAELLKSARGAPTVKSSETKTRTEDTASPPHILVVDDSITTRTLEKNILEAAGYRVTTAIDGLQALQKLESNDIELVVMDVQMPHLDGFGLTQQLRESTKYRSLPIVLVTSLESREDREKGMAAGADAYIVKRGFDQVELLAAIERMLMKEQPSDG